MSEPELSRTADALQEQAAEVVVALHQRQKADDTDPHELVRRIGAVWEWYMAVPRERDPMIVARERLRSLQGYLEERTINDPAGVLGPVPAAGFTFPPNYAALKPRPAPEKLAQARVVLILDVDGVLVRLPPREGVRLLHTVDEEGIPWDLDVFDLVPLDDILEEFPAPELEVAFLSSWAAAPTGSSAFNWSTIGFPPDARSSASSCSGRISNPEAAAVLCKQLVARLRYRKHPYIEDFIATVTWLAVLSVEGAWRTPRPRRNLGRRQL